MISIAEFIPLITPFTNPLTDDTRELTALDIPENTPETNPVSPFHADCMPEKIPDIKLPTDDIMDETILYTELKTLDTVLIIPLITVTTAPMIPAIKLVAPTRKTGGSGRGL